MHREPIRDKYKQQKVSEKSEELSRLRGIAKKNRNVQESERLSKEYKKQKRRQEATHTRHITKGLRN